MLEINRVKTETLDYNTTKLIITTNKNATVTTKLKPKQVEPTQQTVKPEENQSIEPLFIIY